MIAFQNLDVYRCSIELLSITRQAITHLPRGASDLADQLRRSARSIPQNIAEGAGKTARTDKAKYFAIARGSAMESVAHLDVMRVDELVNTELYQRGIDLLERIISMLTKMLDL